MASEQFSKQLDTFKIDLDEDAIEYIGGMLSDMSLTDHEEVRESTETFLIDASIDDDTRDDFYKALFSNQLFQANSEPVVKQGPTLISKKPLFKQSEPKVNTSEKKTFFSFFF